MFVDVHAHLVHESFPPGEDDAAATRAAEAGVDRIIVNGLEPISNRAVLALCARHPNLRAALGIYPVDATAHLLARDTWQHPWGPPAPFDPDAEIAFIAEQAAAKTIIAIGECGLDAYWDTTHLAEQERVLRRLLEVARATDLPVILHTRKAEERTFAILTEMGITRADFHCFGGKLKLAQRIAEAGYYLSIPPVVARNEAFQKMSAQLPLSQILTETDCPYMGPVANARNEPANVPGAVAVMAKLRGLDTEAMGGAIRANYQRLFRD